MDTERIDSPVDDRADRALRVLLQPFNTTVDKVGSYPDIIKTMNDLLPNSVARDAEIMLVRKGKANLVIKQRHAREIVRDIIRMRICNGLVTLENQCYFSRQDIADWINNNPGYDTKLQVPPPEEFKVTVEGVSNTMIITEPQLVGICYGLDSNAVNAAGILINVTTVIGQFDVEYTKIVDNSLVYNIAPDLATEEFKRPYRVEVNNADNQFHPARFDDPEFLQGLISIPHWAELPNDGNGSLWRNLQEFTREGWTDITY